MADHATDLNQIDSFTPSWGILSRTFDLLPGDSGEADGNGPWVDVRCLKKLSCQVSGSFGGGTVQLYGSNHPDPVHDETEVGVAIGTAFSAAGLQKFDGPYRYIRAVIADATNPAAKAFLHGVC